MLDPYYDLAATMIGLSPVQPDPVSGELPQRTRVIADLPRRFGNPNSVFRPNLAVTFTPPGADPIVHNRFGVQQSGCVYTGECDIGCNVGAKNSLDLNYLAAAEQHGAEVLTRAEVTHISAERGGYRVHLVDHGDNGRERSLTAHQVFLCAGSLGSTEILLRSRDQHHTLADISSALGGGYSGNGDFLAFGYDTVDLMDSGVGPTITSACVLRGTVDGVHQWVLVEDGGYSALLVQLVGLLDMHRLAPFGFGTRRKRPTLPTGHRDRHVAALLAMGETDHLVVSTCVGRASAVGAVGHRRRPRSIHGRRAGTRRRGGEAWRPGGDRT